MTNRKTLLVFLLTFLFLIFAHTKKFNFNEAIRIDYLNSPSTQAQQAETQRPLAAVVIGGIISSAILTLLVLLGFYSLVYSSKKKKNA